MKISNNIILTDWYEVKHRLSNNVDYVRSDIIYKKNENIYQYSKNINSVYIYPTVSIKNTNKFNVKFCGKLREFEYIFNKDICNKEIIEIKNGIDCFLIKVSKLILFL